MCFEADMFSNYSIFPVVASERPIITVENNAVDEIEMYNNLVEKITVDKYRNLTIRCGADEPIHWIDAWSLFPTLWAAPFAWNFQESSMYLNSAKFNEGTFRMSYLNNSKHKHPFKSDLNLIDIDNRFVGFYFCVKNSSSFSKLSALHEYSDFSTVSNIYLNVKGKIFVPCMYQLMSILVQNFLPIQTMIILYKNQRLISGYGIAVWLKFPAKQLIIMTKSNLL